MSGATGAISRYNTSFKIQMRRRHALSKRQAERLGRPDKGTDRRTAPRPGRRLLDVAVSLASGAIRSTSRQSTANSPGRTTTSQTTSGESSLPQRSPRRGAAKPEPRPEAVFQHLSIFREIRRPAGPAEVA
ncbi:hypothetical protein Salmuc_02617 [Salipiger mucosus DSM 16094]|uniref:Uncharacterized protein n=1 Tax=Salipiger mucosus DSM 16094 TaxID=1123237 RepID=S9QZX7_9RHOB|nr:hypothetical protein Salmuc_02617 [Salipiger mucosus DSM 16094]